MENIQLKAKLKNVQAKESGPVIQLEPLTGQMHKVADLMMQVGHYVYVTFEDEQQELPIQELECEYEQPVEGQTEIEVDGEDIFEPVVMSLPEPDEEE